VIRALLVAAALFLILSRTGHAQPDEHSIGFSPGLFAASGFGTNPAVIAGYTYSFFGSRWFVEASLGFGSLRSKVLESVSRSRVFNSDRLFFYQFGAAFDYSPRGGMPHVLFGVAGVDQGGQSKFAGVVGLGKRIPLPGLFGGNSVGVRYDVRDLIFSQQVNNGEPFLAHNIVVSLGVQVVL
jgi:hypothetical protein